MAPSKKGYWLGGGIIVLGVIGAVVWFALGFLSFSDEIDDFQRVPTNEEGELVLEEGGYVVYYEAPGADDGEIPTGRALVTSADGVEVDLEDYDSELTYSTGDYSGRAVLTFDIDRPGTYVFESETDGDGEMAIGRSVGGKLVRTIVGSMGLGGLGVVVGAIVIIVTAVRRRNARSQANPYYAPPPGGPSYPPPPPPPPPGPPPGPGASGPPPPAPPWPPPPQ